MSQETHQNLPGYSTRWIGLLFIGISLLVISLDNTILNVALPSISNDLGASASDLQWIVDAYVLVFAALLLTMGSHHHDPFCQGSAAAGACCNGRGF